MNILQRLNRRERIILYALAAITALSVLYNFIMEPMARHWIETNREIRLANVRLQKALSILRQKKDIDGQYYAYAERLKPHGSDEQEMTRLLNEAEVVARSANLKIVNMQPKPAQDRQFYKRFVVEIDTESDIGSLMKFIYDLKNSPQMLKVERLTLNTKSDTAGITIKASMVISKVSLK